MASLRRSSEVYLPSSPPGRLLRLHIVYLSVTGLLMNKGCMKINFVGVSKFLVLSVLHESLYHVHLQHLIFEDFPKTRY